jgi:hypothetical protein
VCSQNQKNTNQKLVGPVHLKDMAMVGVRMRHAMRINAKERQIGIAETP